MIFITGASRSGTTLLSYILRNHSQIYGLNELQYFGEFWDPRNDGTRLSYQQMTNAVAWMLARQARGIIRGKPSAAEREEAQHFVESLPSDQRNPAGLFAAVVTNLSARAGKRIPCEQTPRNIFYAEALLRSYPAAHVVHMLRDPRAVMASQRQRWRRRYLAADKHAIPIAATLRVFVNYHPYTVAKLWAGATGEASRLMKHPRFTAIRFEDLVGSPEQTIPNLCSRLNIGFEKGMLDVSHINSSHQSSVGGARTGLNKRAVDQWRSALPESEARIAERICGKLMSEHGYTPEAGEPRGELRYQLTYPLHIAGVLAVNPRRALIQIHAAFQGGRHR